MNSRTVKKQENGIKYKVIFYFNSYIYEIMFEMMNMSSDDDDDDDGKNISSN